MRGSVVHQDARYEGIINHLSRLNHSCNKLHATRKSVNHVPWLNHSCYEEIGESRIGIHYSCNKLRATRESWIAHRGWIFRASRCTLRGNRWIAYRGWIFRASRCTLHPKWITLLTVDNTLFEKTHAKITALYFVPCVVHSCNKLHATRESWITYRGWIIRATSCTLRGVKDARYGHRVKRYRYK